MPPSPPTWPRRVMAGLPPMPDTLLVVGGLLLMLVMGGILGLLACLQPRVPERPSLQQQLDALDTRLRTLEQR